MRCDGCKDHARCGYWQTCVLKPGSIASSDLANSTFNSVEVSFAEPDPLDIPDVLGEEPSENRLRFVSSDDLKSMIVYKVDKVSMHPTVWTEILLRHKEALRSARAEGDRARRELSKERSDRGWEETARRQSITGGMM